MRVRKQESLPSVLTKSGKNNSASPQVWDPPLRTQFAVTWSVYARFSVCNAILNQDMKEVVAVYLRLRMSWTVFLHPKISCRKRRFEASLSLVYNVARHGKHVNQSTVDVAVGFFFENTRQIWKVRL
jgi:hypothetical protein